MLAQQWRQVIYFDSAEFDDPLFVGSGIHADGLLVLLLDKLRITMNCPIITHSKAGGCVDMQGSHGHSPVSYHLYSNGCRAADFHIRTHMTLREQYNHVCRAGFGGVGVYPWWGNPGFHVDVRPLSLTNHWYSPKKGVYEVLFP